MAAVCAAEPEFRAMRTADLEWVAPLAQAADPFGWTLRNFQDALATGYRCTVVQYNGTIVGYAVVMQVFDEAELLEIAIAPAWQGQGLGRRTLCFVLEQARRSAARVMHLEVRFSNLRALALYESQGFKRVGLRRNYYPTAAAREDAVLMTCDVCACSQPN